MGFSTNVVKIKLICFISFYKQYFFDDLPSRKNILFRKSLETTWVFSIISTAMFSLKS